MEPLNDAGGSPLNQPQKDQLQKDQLQKDQPQTPMTNRTRNRFAPLFVASVTVALVLLIGTVLTYTARANSVDSTDAPQLSVPAAHQHDNDFDRVAKAVEPTVVNINTESTIKNPHQGLRRMPTARSQRQSGPRWRQRHAGLVRPLLRPAESRGRSKSRWREVAT